jgi:hypothetical protein
MEGGGGEGGKVSMNGSQFKAKSVLLFEERVMV